MFIKSVFYTILLLQFCITVITAGPVHKAAQTTTQVGKIKAAKSGMASCSIKARLCNVAAGITQVGAELTGSKTLERKAQHWDAKVENNLKKMKGHAEDLRVATKTRDTSGNFGGVKSEKHQTRVINSGVKTLKKYDNRVASANKANKAAASRQNSGSFGRLNSFDMMSGAI